MDTPFRYRIRHGEDNDRQPYLEVVQQAAYEAYRHPHIQANLFDKSQPTEKSDPMRRYVAIFFNQSVKNL